ncbi:hypothetical protein ACVIOG_003972 [Rhizobium leguminosarum]
MRVAQKCAAVLGDMHKSKDFTRVARAGSDALENAGQALSVSVDS